MGGGGQRYITVYAPYWIVNTSQYVLRYREEQSDSYPAGSVVGSKDGTKAVFGGDDDNFRKIAERTVFPGKPGPLTFKGDIAESDPLCEMLGELSEDDIAALAFAFNFNSGNKRMVVQLNDTNWSRPFSLDSVGIPQELSIERETVGNLELGFRIDLAPGSYGKFTRVVRFSPKFLIVNKLPYNVKMLQPTGIVGEFDGSFHVLSNHRKPFHLPSIYGKRKLSVDLEGSWRPSVMFNVDMTGEFSLVVKKQIPLASIPHIITRQAIFSVSLPPQELGIWFETGLFINGYYSEHPQDFFRTLDWKQTDIVVKAVRSGHYVSNYTDIQVGDVLLSVNGVKATGKNFDTIMQILKRNNRTVAEADQLQNLAQPSPGLLLAEFMSSEYKLSLIRYYVLMERRYKFSFMAPLCM